jgi:hypothetical protein
MKFINKKLLCINEELAYKKIVNCTNKPNIIYLGEYLDKVKHKWESRVRKDSALIKCKIIMYTWKGEYTKKTRC